MAECLTHSEKVPQSLLRNLSSHFGKVDFQMTRQSKFSSRRKISVIIEEIDQEQEKIGQV